ncbi:type II toxin-antitoxin system VapC family toxin [Candidatus Woesearchaeota archaeon]|nr:type II toxin-antitoxin system VapC family toxin [Candidatus Woesearchaeota archaeon]
MRFIDTNVFVHAFLKPRKSIQPHEAKIKQQAKKILQKIDDGEVVVTSTVSLSEIINIIEANYAPQEAWDVISSILLNPNIKFCSVEKNHYVTALIVAKELNRKINDSLSVTLMKKLGVSEIYSFDTDFDNIKTITRLRE